MSEQKPQWREIGRVFPFSDADFDPAYLSPDGGHVDGVLVPPTHPEIAAKIPAPTPHIIIQNQVGDDKDIKHVQLTAAEWKKLQAAREEGKLDPDGNGTNRLVSQATLTQLGLGRIQEMLAFPSGAQELAL